jgi:Mrp family chromosome partitioning ATPase
MEQHTTTATQRKAKYIIAIMSGKGGVGKSVVAGLLAVGLRRQGWQVGLLDGDLTSPAIVSMFDTEIRLSMNEEGTVEPLMSASGVKIMSMTVFQEHVNDPIVWRGPMIASAFKQFYSDIDWGDLDYLIVDVPTGTSDVPMTVLHSLPLDGIVIVSSPQKQATAVTQRCVNMIRQFKGRIIGFVENMVYFMAPEGEYYEIFGPSNVHGLTTMIQAPLLTQLPLSPELAACCDAGQIEAYRAETVNRLVSNVLATLIAPQ